MDGVLFPDEIVIKTEYFTVAQDWEVPIEGFFIISSNRKLRSVAEFSDEESLEFVRLLRRVRKEMEEALSIKEVYLFQNENTEHGFHLWMFPRLEWMEQYGRKIQSVRPIMEHAKKEMATEEVIHNVKDAAARVRERMKDFSFGVVPP